jgi:hypothetical protein
MESEIRNETLLWQLRHDRRYHFYKEISICDLTPDHKSTRLEFTAEELRNPIGMPIVFTDESTV